jgi:hypothetical protein
VHPSIGKISQSILKENPIKKLTLVLTILALLVAGTTAASAQTVAQLYANWKLLIPKVAGLSDSWTLGVIQVELIRQVIASNSRRTSKRKDDRFQLV